jgi:hypothetical protein
VFLVQCSIIADVSVLVASNGFCSLLQFQVASEWFSSMHFLRASVPVASTYTILPPSRRTVFCENCQF